MNRLLSLLLISSTLYFFACNNKKDKNYEPKPEAIYFDYQITGKEGDDNLTVMLQYRDGGEDGDAIAVGKVILDGEIVTVDSAKMTGFFYELHKPISSFSGKHTIVFTDADQKEYKEEFEFQPVVLLTAIADTIKKNELVFSFQGMEAEDYIRVVLTDTSFYNDGINVVSTVSDGKLVISQSDLANIALGPVQLEFIREYERPVKNGTEAGGRLLITYSLKREFIMKD